MDWLSGKKTYITAALVAVCTGLVMAGLITDAQAQAAYGVLAAFGLYALRDGVAKSGPAAVLLLAFGIASSPAYAQDRGIVHDGTIDLRALLVGRTLAVDAGFVSVGIRSKPTDISGIDLEPTGISLLKAGCSWGLPRSLLALQCEPAEPTVP